MKATWALLVVLTVVFGVQPAKAQQDQQGGGQRGGPGGGGGWGGRRGPGMMMQGRRGGGMMGMMGGMLRRYDTNENMLVEETEIDAALKELKERADVAYALLLNGIDADGDGKLGTEEVEAVQELMRTLGSLRQSDENKDLKLDDAEIAKARERLLEMTKRYNEAVLGRVDTNKDGQLSAEEVAEAKKQMEARRQEWEKQRQERGGGAGGGERRAQ